MHGNSESPTTYSVEADLQYADGRHRQARYWMSDERAGWRVCRETVLN